MTRTLSKPDLKRQQDRIPPACESSFGPGLYFFRLTPPRQALGLFLLAPLLRRSHLFVVGRPSRQDVRHVDDSLTDGSLGKVFVKVGSRFVATTLSRPVDLITEYRSARWIHEPSQPELTRNGKLARPLHNWQARPQPDRLEQSQQQGPRWAAAQPGKQAVADGTFPISEPC